MASLWRLQNRVPIKIIVSLEMERLDAHISAEAATHSRFSFPGHMPSLPLVELKEESFEDSSLVLVKARGLLLRKLL